MSQKNSLAIAYAIKRRSRGVKSAPVVQEPDLFAEQFADEPEDEPFELPDAPEEQPKSNRMLAAILKKSRGQIEG